MSTNKIKNNVTYELFIYKSCEYMYKQDLA